MNIYVDGVDYLSEMYNNHKECDRRAKTLQREGWTVTYKKYHFHSFGDIPRYCLAANRQRLKKE